MRAISHRSIVKCLVAALLLAFVAGPTHAQQQNDAPTTVQKTYNDAPFKYTQQLQDDRPDFFVYRWTYPSPVVTPVEPNNTVPALYYLPKTLEPGRKYPAVICLHILDGNEQLTDLVCSVLASRGIPAISFKMPYYGERGGPKGPEAMAENAKMFLGAVGQVIEDIRRTIDLLASRQEINPDRIGITGISLGGITAAAAAGAEPRLHRACLILSGGDLPTIIHHARETRELCQMIDALPPEDRTAVDRTIADADPLKYAAALRDRAKAGQVLMVNAGDDEVIPRACTEKLANELGILDQVVWFDGLGHYTAMAELPRAMKMTADFFAKDLLVESGSENVKKTPGRPTTPLQRLASVVQQLVTMLTVEPAEGRCHYFDLDVTVTLGDGKQYASQIRFVRGSGDRFSLQCQLPVVGTAAMGQNEYPWMVAGDQKVMIGSKNPLPNHNALDYVDAANSTRFQMVMASPAASRWPPTCSGNGSTSTTIRRRPAAVRSGSSRNRRKKCRAKSGFNSPRTG